MSTIYATLIATLAATTIGSIATWFIANYAFHRLYETLQKIERNTGRQQQQLDKHERYFEMIKKGIRPK
jgi:membrane protein YqaA with SNARE-associated domain